VIIGTFGLVLVVPQLKKVYELLISKWTARSGSGGGARSGFLGGTLVGISLGLIWTPCVGPILASVIALALTGSVSGAAVLITLAYALGTAGPMLLIMVGGRGLLNRVPWLLRNLENIQRFFGILLILVALAMTFNLDRKFQIFILDTFPSYGRGLTQIETIPVVQEQLQQTMPTSAPIDPSSFAPELVPGGEWFNSDPLTLEQLRGKVVLVDFWTYSCINCIRTLPYIEEWYEKYKDEGLVIIGVHTPEFEFEKEAKNVQQAIRDFGLTYPVVQDNDYGTWQAYQNHYWPAKYFIDRKGNVRDSHYGEGDYDESEQLIRDLLEEDGTVVEAGPINNLDYTIDSLSPETYTGYGRMSNFASPEQLQKDTEAIYTTPKNLSRNEWAYGGSWNVGKEKAVAGVGSTLTFQFEAKNVFLVMNPVDNQMPVPVEVYMDGELINILTIDKDRLYDLVKNEVMGEHRLELRFLEGGSEVYAFTFG